MYDSSIDWEQDNTPENIESIKTAIANAIDREVPIELRCVSSESKYDESYMDLKTQLINFEIENIDDEDEEEEDF